MGKKKLCTEIIEKKYETATAFGFIIGCIVIGVLFGAIMAEGIDIFETKRNTNIKNITLDNFYNVENVEIVKFDDNGSATIRYIDKNGTITTKNVILLQKKDYIPGLYDAEFVYERKCIMRKIPFFKNRIHTGRENRKVFVVDDMNKIYEEENLRFKSTFLARCVRKGYLTSRRESKFVYYKPIRTEEELLLDEINEMARRYCFLDAQKADFQKAFTEMLSIEERK